jgi:hypothetical protein
VPPIAGVVHSLDLPAGRLGDRHAYGAGKARCRPRIGVTKRWDLKLESLGHRLTATFERGIADAVTSQTRTLVCS